MKKFLLFSISFLIIAAGLQSALADFRAYSQGGAFERTSKKVSVICDSPCPYTPKQLNKSFHRFNRQLGTLERSIGAPLPAFTKPVEVRLNYNETGCRERVARAPNFYAKAKGFTINKDNGRAIICLNEDIEKIRRGESAFAHELAHQYFMILAPGTQENWDEAVVHLALTRLNPSADFSICAPDYPSKATYNNVCERFGFDIKHVDSFLRRVLPVRAMGGKLTNEIIENAIRAAVAEFTK